MADGRIIDKSLSLDELVSRVTKETSRKGGGALVLFIGYVKGRVEGSEVRELDYEAYEPYASEKLREIARKYEQREGVLDVEIYHRTGDLKPGEITLYVIVAAKSRYQAFETAREALEEVKHNVPIFKLEKRNNGEYWVIGNGKRVKRPRQGSDHKHSSQK